MADTCSICTVPNCFIKNYRVNLINVLLRTSSNTTSCTSSTCWHEFVESNIEIYETNFFKFLFHVFLSTQFVCEQHNVFTPNVCNYYIRWTITCQNFPLAILRNFITFCVYFYDPILLRCLICYFIHLNTYHTYVYANCRWVWLCYARTWIRWRKRKN